MKIGNRLRALRTNRGYAPEFIAEKLGVSLITYRRLERNESVPDINLLEKLAELYQVSVSNLLIDENIILSNGQVGGTANNAIIINQLSDKLIEQYEIRIKEKDIIIVNLQSELSKLKN